MIGITRYMAAEMHGGPRDGERLVTFCPPPRMIEFLLPSPSELFAVSPPEAHLPPLRIARYRLLETADGADVICVSSYVASQAASPTDFVEYLTRDLAALLYVYDGVAT